MAESINLTMPVGRLVQGSLYKGSSTNLEGQPLVVKSGPNAGQSRGDYFFAVAIPKGGEPHWNQTPWGRQIYDLGVRAWPAGQTGAPTFAWKITDGDSTVPNKKGRRPCDREGHPGHWVVGFSSGYVPKIYNRDGTAPIQEPDAVKLGYYVQVACNVAGNGNAINPGIYINHNMVALSGYGPEIIVGPDAASVGFGQAPLPPGASAIPVGAMPAPADQAPAPAYQAPAPAPIVVQPNPAFLQAAPSPPPAPPALPTPRSAHGTLTAKAAGATYDQLLAVGWTDATLSQHGMLLDDEIPF